ncbi:MAG TPA: 3-phosphoshikimate 1-carboxyvinyltransferase [Gaiellaceae bacterium]|nr:3-phosphoshikimate 1-carboxyvinyltransferase [Gaiellaceae bacterium]
MRVEPAASLRGGLAVPGDKSISHRAVLLGAIADGETHITGFGRSGDTESTIAAVRALGADVEDDGAGLVVRGVGLHGLRSPGTPIDCGNAGTLVRLVAGILAGQPGQRFELIGDESLSRRPMGRVVDPLTAMGAAIEATEGRLPLRVEGRTLRPIRYELPVASAQVKSCVLLAGLYADDGPTAVVEPVATRDHTERMLRAAGARVRSAPGLVEIWPADSLQPLRLEVPGDFSSAAPFLVAATLVPGSRLRLANVSVNPTRTGLLHVLERMGARISLYNRGAAGGEPVADVEVEHADLVATEVAPEEVPALIDELPLFALAAAMARGDSSVRGAAELRQKETDRIETVTTALRALGVRITGTEDGFRVRGVPSRPRGGAMRSGGDHRIAMLGAVAGLVSREGVRIEGAEAVSISFPGFFDLLAQVAQR